MAHSLLICINDGEITTTNPRLMPEILRLLFRNTLIADTFVTFLSMPFYLSIKAEGTASLTAIKIY